MPEIHSTPTSPRYKIKQSLRALMTLITSLIALKADASVALKKIFWVPQRTPHPKLLPLFSDFPNPSFLGRPSNETAASHLPEVVEISAQKIGSATIEGTWVKKIYDASGAQVFEAGEVTETPPWKMGDWVRYLDSRKIYVQEELSWQLPGFRTASKVFEPDVQVSQNLNGSFSPSFIVDFINESQDAAFEARLGPSLQLLSVRPIGSHLIDGTGSVYKRGKKFSALSNETLPGMSSQSADLRNPDLNVFSAKTGPLISPERIYTYPSSDDRLEQVQVYFYADQILRWFKERFDASPRAQIEIKVQVGERSNVALYLRNSIRLGSGDGERYRDLAFDPSVVMHEVGHAIVDRYAGLPSDGDGGAANEAFADFFAACLLDNPRMGDQAYLKGEFLRSLENNSRAPLDLQRGIYSSSLVISGTLWDLQYALGRAMAETLAFRTLSRLGPAFVFHDFPVAVQVAADTMELTTGQRSILKEVLTARGWL